MNIREAMTGSKNHHAKRHAAINAKGKKINPTGSPLIRRGSSESDWLKIARGLLRRVDPSNAITCDDVSIVNIGEPPLRVDANSIQI